MSKWKGRLCFFFSWSIYFSCALSPLCSALSQVLTPLLPSVLQEYFLKRNVPMLQPLALPLGLSVGQALERVLRLPAVASKRYLTNKVLPEALPCSSDLCPLPSAYPPRSPTLGDCHGGLLGEKWQGQGRKPGGLGLLLPTLRVKLLFACLV